MTAAEGSGSGREELGVQWSRRYRRESRTRFAPPESPPKTIREEGTPVASMKLYASRKDSRWAGHFLIGERAVCVSLRDLDLNFGKGREIKVTYGNEVPQSPSSFLYFQLLQANACIR